MNCDDCVYTDIADWEQDARTGKATPIYWCERYKKLCSEIAKCKYKADLQSAYDSGYKKAKNDLGVDVISRADALRVAKNEYLRGWHDALCKALCEEYSIHCEEGNFSVIQEETITGLGLSMDCAVGKDVESYMSTIPLVAPHLERNCHYFVTIRFY